MYLVVHEPDLAEDGSLAPALVVDAACVIVISHWYSALASEQYSICECNVDYGTTRDALKRAELEH